MIQEFVTQGFVTQGLVALAGEYGKGFRATAGVYHTEFRTLASMYDKGFRPLAGVPNCWSLPSMLQVSASLEYCAKGFDITAHP